jgi:uncharacterized protein (DUF952 family)
MTADLVYKVLRPAEWAAAQETGQFAGSRDDQRDGFVHLSAAHQVRGVCDRYFAGESALVLLTIEVARLGPPLKWEISHKGEAFPHLYGSLPLALVQSIADIRRGEDGRLAFPPEIPDVRPD